MSVGQALTPITLDELLPSGDLLFAERSAVGSIFGDQLDIGVWAHHRFERYGYHVGLYGGTGANRLQLDIDRFREFMARFEFFPHEGLRFGTSTQRTLGANVRDIHTLLGGDVQYTHDRVVVQSEVYWRQTTNQASFVPDVHARGGYIAAAYRVDVGGQDWQPAIRFDLFDPDRRMNGDAYWRTTGAIGWPLPWQGSRLHLDYTHTHADVTSRLGVGAREVVTVQTQMAF